jgi:tetratricopeptide (TPR) repeat protein
LIKVYPANKEGDNPYEMLAEAHRNLGETNLEREVLARLAERDADSVEVFQRLMVLGSLAGDWPVVATNAARYLAVNPLTPQPYRHLAQASAALGWTNEAIRAGRTLLLLDPPDPAAAHFQLARLLYQTGDAGAKRHLLQALEEAPRFREGHRLLLEMAAAPAPTATNAPASRPVRPAGPGGETAPPAK